MLFFGSTIDSSPFERVSLILLLFSGYIGIGFAQNPPPVSFQLKGAWNDPITFETNLNQPPGRSAVIADFNGDGKLDVLTITYGSSNYVLLAGNGDGTFEPPDGDIIGGFLYSVTAGDLAGDGTLYLVAPGDGWAQLAGPSPSRFGDVVDGQLNWFSMTGHFATLGDFNKDGKPDVAVTFGSPTEAFAGNSVAVFLGNGDFSEQVSGVLPFETTPAAVYPVGVNPEFLAQGDFNGDGNLDLAVPNCAGIGCPENVPGVSSISVLLGNGDGTFRTGATYPWGISAYSVVVGDFNRDGKLDLAASDRAGDSLGVFLGNGDGSFQAPAEYSAGFGQWNVTAGDFNSDGSPDLAVCVDNEAAVAVFLGNGSGTFQSAAKYAIPFDINKTGPNGVCETTAIGDFNGDQRADIVVFDESQRLMEILLNTTTFNNTILGTSVGVQPVDTTTATNPVSLTFSNVTQTGVTSLKTSGSGGTPIPSGFQLGSPATYYNISTTATFSGPVSICISYAGTSFNDQTNLRLFHFANGTWTDITTSVDTAHQNICGNTSSFSPFIVAQPIYSTQVQQPINADGSSVFSAKKGVVPVKFNLVAAGVATCSLPRASIALTRTSGSSPGVIDETLYEISSDNGSYFRISSCQYVYNLSAQSLGTGSYRADILIGPQVVGSAAFGLK